MCRLLCASAPAGVDAGGLLGAFARMSRDSREYQGHGWGCAWRDGDGWRAYHSIAPVWEDDLPPIPATPLLLAHARSAFRDEGIAVENNMPFADDGWMFVFNGELRGVRIREHGRIGAEKIFNYVRRFDRGDTGASLERAVSVIGHRTRYIRAMNFVMSNGSSTWCCSHFNEDPGYFQLHLHEAGPSRMICSEPLDDSPGWRAVDNKRIFEL